MTGKRRPVAPAVRAVPQQAVGQGGEGRTPVRAATRTYLDALERLTDFESSASRAREVALARIPPGGRSSTPRKVERRINSMVELIRRQLREQVAIALTDLADARALEASRAEPRGRTGTVTTWADHVPTVSAGCIHGLPEGTCSYCRLPQRRR